MTLKNCLIMTGTRLSVIHPGEYNRDSGPDFFNARIHIAGTVWAGNVEIHTLSSHFNLHGHHDDPAFNNVILHVVAENDKKSFNSQGRRVAYSRIEFRFCPCMKNILSLVNNPYIIACQDEISNIDNIIVTHWLNSLVIERI